MNSQIGIWAVGQGSPRRVGRSSLRLEVDLEDWVANDPSLVMEGLQVVGRQVRVEGGIIDLLALDVAGRWVVIELKRDRLYREVVAQALDYASCIGSIEAGELREKITSGLDRLPSPGSVLSEVDSQLDGEEEGRDVAVVIAGAGVDAGLERVVTYLADFAIPVRVVSFDVFEQVDGSQLLIREVIEDESVEGRSRRVSPKKSIADLAAMAAGCGHADEFNRLMSASSEAGLVNRPYVKTVMIAPSSHRNRCLFWARPQSRGLQVGAVVETVEEYFPSWTQERVREAIGPDDAWVIPAGEPDGRLDALLAFIAQLSAE